jgi:hypothetical protein
MQTIQALTGYCRNTSMSNRTEEGQPFYYEGNNLVLTAKSHLERGYCCGLGCRHCPYQYENVPPPRRNLLLKERKDAGKENNPASKNR